MSDKELRRAIEQELEWDPILDATHIGVTIDDGIVTLTGHVRSYPEKHEAQRAASRVRGVKAVVSELIIGLPEDDLRSDEEIARTAAGALAWNIFVPAGKVKISVENGRVTLEGIVEYQFQRQAADQAVRYLRGVSDVNNHIVVQPKVNRDLVQSEIEGALLRSAEVDAHGIRVEVRGDRVILRGIVQSWPEREEAERAAWASPGVHHVENLLAVSPILVGAIE